MPSPDVRLRAAVSPARKNIRRPNALGSKPNLPLVQIVRVNTPLTTGVVSDSPSQGLFDLHWTGLPTQSKSPAKQSPRTPSKAPPRSPAGRSPKVRIAVPRNAREETADDNLLVLLGALQDLFSHVGKITTAINKFNPQAKHRHGHTNK
ncbi:hypothetical protein QE152_g29106 [Popillia japonica]|uniref:Uncharacterized protein n=1 Tax=Popillia japonica TaxID=7064 RepID=A0AAW1JJ41_POPJA